MDIRELRYFAAVFRERNLTSVATLASLNSSRRRHSTTNSRQTLRMASPLSYGSRLWS